MTTPVRKKRLEAMTEARNKRLIAQKKTVVEGDITHLRSWAAGKGKRMQGRGRPSRDLIREYEADTGRKYVGGKVVSSAPDVSRRKVYKPHCVVHALEMIFDSNDNFFKCPKNGCKIKAMPKAEANKPIIGKGALTILREADGRVYLAADNNVRIDLTDYEVEAQDRYGDKNITAKIDTWFPYRGGN